MTTMITIKYQDERNPNFPSPMMIMMMMVMMMMMIVMMMIVMMVMMVMMMMLTSGERKVTIDARLAISPKRPRLVKSTPDNNQYEEM